VETLLGDPALAKADLGWVPHITLDEMIREMVAHDLDHAQKQALLQRHGYKISVTKE
jgi:GDPmannose 4,6-dehydratase